MKSPTHLLLALAVSAAAGAQGVAPTYQPGIDVADYDIRLELPDTGAFLKGDVSIALRRSGVAVLQLDLVNSLTVRTVEVNGRGVPVQHGNGRIAIPLDATGDSVRVRVVYDGLVSDGLVVRKDKQGRWTWFGDNWPDRAREWLPTVDHPSDKATVSWTIVAPPGRTVLANGSHVSTSTTGSGRTRKTETRWRESRPIPTYLMVIGAGPLVKYDIREPDCHYGDQGQCVRQSVYVMPENRRWLPGVFSAAGPIMSLYERLIAPFPYEKLAHVQSSTRFGGMENASAIFYDDKLFPTQTLSDHLIAHETAHQWFGDSVTEREWSHLWLSEGFATYFAALWTQFVRGEAAYRTEMATIRKQVLEAPVVATLPVLDTAERDYLKLLNTNSYQKGGYILYMLHQQLGDSAFFGGIRAYYAKHRHGTALSDDLRVELETSSGRSLTDFFRQWLTVPGVAEPTIGWAHDSVSGTVTLLVLQSDGCRDWAGSGQVGVSCSRGVRAPYELALPVLITDAAGVTRSIVMNVPSAARASIVLPGRYSAKPRSVAFDPDVRMLARITRL